MVVADVPRLRIWVVELGTTPYAYVSFLPLAVRRRLEVGELLDPCREWSSPLLCLAIYPSVSFGWTLLGLERLMLSRDMSKHGGTGEKQGDSTVSLCDKVRSRHQGRTSWNAAGAAPRGGRFVVGAVVIRRQAEMEIAQARGDSARLRHAGGGDSDDWALEMRQQGKGM
jgi:hypothetical protein